MKKLLMAVAAFGMLLTSCAKDDVAATVEQKEALVSFCVNTPAVATRYGEGTTAQKLYYAVYDETGLVEAISKTTTPVAINLSTNVDLKLIQGRAYQVLFWAVAEGAPYSVDWDAKTMEIDYQNLSANEEVYDAFYKYEDLGKVNGALSKTIELRRPFAQLNIATADTNDASLAGFTVENTGVTVKNIFKTLNFVDGVASDEVETTFVLAEKAEGTITANQKSYDQISMNYLLVNGKKLVNVTLDINGEVTRSYSSVPVERNYRTNIVGNILTSPAHFDVVILPGFTQDDYLYEAEEEIFKYDATKTATENGTALFNTIMNAADNTTIFVPAGTYALGDGQTSRYTNKSITLVGEGEKTILKGDKYGIVIDNAVDPVNTKEFTLKNLTVATDHSWGAGVYAKNNIIVNLEDVIIRTAGPTAILVDNANTYQNGQYYEGVSTVVNAKNVTIDEGDAVELLALPCTTTNHELTTYSKFNYEGGNIGTIKPQGTLNMGSGNLFVNGVALAAGGSVNNVYTNAGLQAAIDNATEGSTIVLGKDVDCGTVAVDELKDVVIEGNEGSVMIFKTTADSKIENVTLKSVNFKYPNGAAGYDSSVVINAAAQIDNLVIEGCTFTGNGEKGGRGLSGTNDNATIVIKNCTFKDLGYPVYGWTGYESLTVEGCTFDNIKSWAIMPQGGFDGDLTVTGCNFINCLGGGLVKAGTLSAGHTFTFTNNTITGCTIAGDHNWFQFNTSAGYVVLSGNKKDGADWTPGTAEGLK